MSTESERAIRSQGTRFRRTDESDARTFWLLPCANVHTARDDYSSTTTSSGGDALDKDRFYNR
jgi:hypothetical protein